MGRNLCALRGISGIVVALTFCVVREHSIFQVSAFPSRHPLSWPLKPPCESISCVELQVRSVRRCPSQWLNTPPAITAALLATTLTVQGAGCDVYKGGDLKQRIFNMRDLGGTFVLRGNKSTVGGGHFYARPSYSPKDSTPTMTTMGFAIENDPFLHQYVFRVKGYNLRSKMTSRLGFLLGSNRNCTAGPIHNFVNVTDISLAISVPLG